MSADLNETLAGMQAKTDAATKGPWEAFSHEGYVAVMHHDRPKPGVRVALVDDGDDLLVPDSAAIADAEFIAMARNKMPALLSAVQNVLALHTSVDIEPSDTICRECSWQLPNGHYFGKLVEWPCPTVEALTDALEASE